MPIADKIRFSLMMFLNDVIGRDLDVTIRALTGHTADHVYQRRDQGLADLSP